MTIKDLFFSLEALLFFLFFYEKALKRVKDYKFGSMMPGEAASISNPIFSATVGQMNDEDIGAILCYSFVLYIYKTVLLFFLYRDRKAPSGQEDVHYI